MSQELYDSYINSYLAETKIQDKNKSMCEICKEELKVRINTRLESRKKARTQVFHPEFFGEKFEKEFNTIINRKERIHPIERFLEIFLGEESRFIDPIDGIIYVYLNEIIGFKNQE